MSRASKVFHGVIGYGLACCALGMIGVGVAMFWGPLRQMLAAPVVIVIGVAVYVAARMLQYVYKQEET
jgi:NADH:ubiquinone oxidoreductase subunit B-like Fe-S oxidoreductase